MTTQDLSSANLGGMNLCGIDFRGKSLRGAYLRGSNLWSANLEGVDLSEVTLADAILRDANLIRADLRDSNLMQASMDGARINGAQIAGAIISSVEWGDVDLRLADLDEIRADFWDVLRGIPDEISGLREALTEGRVDGSIYEGCLIGTIAKLKGVYYATMPGLRPNVARPIERFFLGITEGTVNQISEIVSSWIDLWRTNEKA